MNSREISEYKIKIIKHLIQDSEVVTLVDEHGEFEYPDDLIYERLFPFGRIPETEQEMKTYVTIMVDVPSIGRNNDVVRDVVLTVRVMTHNDLMRVSGRNGTRIDLLAARVDELLNESFDFGIGYVRLVHNKEFVYDNCHFYRELKFQTVELNAPRFKAR